MPGRTRRPGMTPTGIKFRALRRPDQRVARAGTSHHLDLEWRAIVPDGERAHADLQHDGHAQFRPSSLASPASAGTRFEAAGDSVQPSGCGFLVLQLGTRTSDSFGSFATDRWAPKIASCPQCPESDGWPSKRRPSRWANSCRPRLPSAAVT